MPWCLQNVRQGIQWNIRYTLAVLLIFEWYSGLVLDDQMHLQRDELAILIPFKTDDIIHFLSLINFEQQIVRDI